MHADALTHAVLLHLHYSREQQQLEHDLGAAAIVNDPTDERKYSSQLDSGQLFLR